MFITILYFTIGFFLLAVLVHFKTTVYKLKLYLQSFAYLFFSKDYKWKNTDIGDPETDLNKLIEEGNKVEKKTIIFIRHGESLWNETFNRSKNPIYFFPRLGKAVLYDIYLFVIGRRDSWFYDSPLNSVGLHQANELRAEIEKSEGKSYYYNILNGLTEEDGGGSSVIISSNLRRCLSTASVALYDRVNRTDEKIIVQPFLQEISRNADTLSITPPKKSPIVSNFEQHHKILDSNKKPINIQKICNKNMDVSQNTGNKEISGTGLQRLQRFNEFISTRDEDVIIVSGHSLWFRSYFRVFIPHDIKHKGQTAKIHNGGAVAFELQYAGEGDNKVFKIDVDSITPVFKGFK
eukprot:TRINITY_DN1343_c1_g1_i1.p1 TRINITY_DN1343_c1_g1~~TRINITY_DN1343_c1_g1_i1.p1  ORF type:complete len:349 (-),score=93.37 TRINITY_DN1343_c1_g1_i1:206-1252(-)